jgi:hypothetical protein
LVSRLRSILGAQLALAKACVWKWGMWCVWPRCCSPLPRLTGSLLCEYPLDSAQLSNIPAKCFGATHQHEQFVSLRCLVNKNIAHSTCTRLSSSIINLAISISLCHHLRTKTVPCPFLCGTPLHSLLHCCTGHLFSSYLLWAAFEQDITLNTHLQYVVSYEIHWELSES